MIDKQLYQEIKEYCKLNNLKIGDFVNSLLKKAFLLEKYGDKPPFMSNSKVQENKETSIQNEPPKEIKRTELIEEPNEIITEEVIETPIKKTNKRKLA